MLAVLAVILFIVGAILHAAGDNKYVEYCLLIGLAAFAGHFVWAAYGRNRSA
jgi:hypothetical protein